MGVKLFDRVGRGLVLSETGQVVFRYADDIFSLGRELTETLQGRPTHDDIKLVVGVPDIVPKLIVYQLLKPALALEDKVHIVCYEGKLQELLSDLALHRLDIVLADSPSTSNLNVRAFNHLLGECGVSVLGTSALAKRFKKDFPASLEGAPMLLPTQNTPLRRALEQWTGPGPLLQFPTPAKSYDSKQQPKTPAGDPNDAAAKRARSDRYGSSGLSDEQEADGKYARTAVAMLEEFARNGERQFFLSLGSSRPHTPLICPQKYIDMYDPRKIPLPHAPRAADQGVPDLAVRFGRSADIWMSRKPSDDEVKATIAAYYGCVTFLDTQLGLVLDSLEKSGLADNTIVIFFSDHGFHLGEHGHWSKYTLFEQSTRVPVIVHIPGNASNGSRCDEIIELVDLVPTMGELLGMAVPAKLEGTSFVPLLRNPAQPWKKAAFSVYGNEGQYNSVRTKQHRYTEWKHDGAIIKELYDTVADPWETVNLADNAKVGEKQAELTELLHQGWSAALPKE